MGNVMRRAWICLVASTCLSLGTPGFAEDRPKIDSRIYECHYLYKQHPGMGVIMILGDSNVTADVMEPQTGLPTVFNMNPINGLCYPAREPLMGTIANNGSPWVRLGNALVNKNVYKDVLLIPVLLEGSTIADWRQDGRITPRLQKMLVALAKQEIPIHAVIWQHGQKNDEHLKSADDYKTGLNEVVQMIRNGGVTAPVFIAKTGSCIGKPSGPVWEAQSTVLEETSDIRAGADTSRIPADLVNATQCTLTDKGVDAYVQQWLSLLRSE